MQIGWQLTHHNAGELRSLAADRGREFRRIDHAHNARNNAALYGQQALSEIVYNIKCAINQ